MSDIEKTASPEAGNVDKQLAPIAGADEALNFLRRTETHGVVVEIDEKTLVRKIDWMVMPVSFLRILAISSR